MESELRLAELLQALRAELESARASGTSADVTFDVKEVQLDLNIVISKAHEGEARVDFCVVNTGSKAESTAQRTQHIRLTLTPSGPGGELRVSKTGFKLHEDVAHEALPPWPPRGGGD